MARASNSAGALRQRIIIQTGTPTDDDRGGATIAWSTHVTAWASVNPINAREAFTHGRVEGSVTHRVRLRYQAGITPKMRVLWGTRVLLIMGVRNEGEMNRWLELDTIEEAL